MADVDYFLKISGIQGESQDRKHSDEKEVGSWGGGLTKPASGPAGAGRPTFQDFSILEKVDKASPRLAQACVTSEPFPEAVLAARRAACPNFPSISSCSDSRTSRSRSPRRSNTRTLQKADGAPDTAGELRPVTMSFPVPPARTLASPSPVKLSPNVDGGTISVRERPGDATGAAVDMDVPRTVVWRTIDTDGVLVYRPNFAPDFTVPGDEPAPCERLALGRMANALRHPTPACRGWSPGTTKPYRMSGAKRAATAASRPRA
jgi:hypothetical protein